MAGAVVDALMPVLKKNLIITHDEDDDLLLSYLRAAVSYAESYQHMPFAFYDTNVMSPATEQAVVMLASYFHESRDGGTGGFFADRAAAADGVWSAVTRLLRMDKDVLV
jgi:hypothetical protein